MIEINLSNIISIVKLISAIENTIFSLEYSLQNVDYILGRTKSEEYFLEEKSRIKEAIEDMKTIRRQLVKEQFNGN